MIRKNTFQHLCWESSSDSESDDDEDDNHGENLELEKPTKMTADNRKQELNDSTHPEAEKEAITPIERAVLIQMHTMDVSEGTKDPDNVEIEYGNERPIFPTGKSLLYNKKLGLGLGLFYGRCFLCGCAGHSQSYCPIKYCARCNTFGHSQITCEKTQGHHIYV
jgi:hypothetical protein